MRWKLATAALALVACGSEAAAPDASDLADASTTPDTQVAQDVASPDVLEDAAVGVPDVPEEVDTPPAPVVCPGADEAAGSLLVHPYLQRATPSAITILWETEDGGESRVDWGPTPELGQVACGEIVEPWRWLELEEMLHGVRLEGLAPDTRYWYRVTTGDLVGEVLDFRTPPEPGDPEPFRILAMSDSQRAGHVPDKFREVVEDGALAFLETWHGDVLADELAMVLMAGDLVDQGWAMEEWTDELFLPLRELLGHVPLYPVFGNHEGSSILYLRYFDLPLNGTEGSEEHWYHFDYANLRVIGLDSNSGFRTVEQLDWLQSVLDVTCGEPTIDFVFAQLHHPHRSEAWTPGNTDWTGEVIERLETFSTACGKPSIHFFGHTHAYSRGQSMDHAHVMVNVASAGGAIDYWNEHDQADYPEYTVTQDEWGFVLVDVEGGDDPSFSLRRVSRGDDYTALDNEVTDTLTVRRYEVPPATPQPVLSDEPLCVETPLLVGGPFEDPDGQAHQASHWQVAADCDGFDAPLAERWMQDQNWFKDVDLQAGDDLTDVVVHGLDPTLTTACWRVRYRDAGLAWSAWSEPQPVALETCF